jgi:polysaccharide biosynthesis protein PslH
VSILILSTKLPFPSKDGGSIAVMNMAEGFVKNGHKVTILSMSTQKHPVSNIPSGILKRINIITVPVNTKVRFFEVVVNIFSPLPYIVKRFYSKTYNNKLISILQQHDFDIIQFEGLYLAEYQKTAQRYSSALLSMRTHNIEHEIWQRIIFRKSMVIRLPGKLFVSGLEKYEISMLNRFDVIVPISKRDMKKFKKHGITKPMCSVPFALDISDFKHTCSQKTQTNIIYIGALDWMPNQEGLLWFIDYVWPDIHRENSGARFCVAGRNCPEHLKRKIDRNDLNIFFEGEVEDAYKFMDMGAVMVVPLFAGSGMRIKIIEGMAMGKTIVTTSLGLEGIDAVNQQDVLVADDAKGFADAALKVMNDKKLYEKIGNNAYNFVKDNFDIFANTSSLMDFYKNNI